MRYAGIRDFDIADGPGVRVALFVSGCRNKCPGCFNRDAQEFDYGLAFTREAANALLHTLGRPEIRGLTVLGGEPLEPENQPQVLELLKHAKKTYPEKDIWLYTGLVYEDLVSGISRVETPCLDPILGLVDVLVDGPFLKEQADATLAFCGSKNQRLIDLAKMRETGTDQPIAWSDGRDTAGHDPMTGR